MKNLRKIIHNFPPPFEERYKLSERKSKLFLDFLGIINAKVVQYFILCQNIDRQNQNVSIMLKSIHFYEIINRKNWEIGVKL